MRSTLFAVPLALAVLLAAPAGRANDYPTEVIADYVLACMAANGNTAEALRQCSCSIDVLASLLDYKDYSKAETVLRMRQVRGGGEKMALFRETPFAKSEEHASELQSLMRISYAVFCLKKKTN